MKYGGLIEHDTNIINRNHSTQVVPSARIYVIQHVMHPSYWSLSSQSQPRAAHPSNPMTRKLKSLLKRIGSLAGKIRGKGIENWFLSVITKHARGRGWKEFGRWDNLKQIEGGWGGMLGEREQSGGEEGKDFCVYWVRDVRVVDCIALCGGIQYLVL